MSQFWSNEVHSPAGKAGRLDLCHGGKNALRGPLSPAAATQRAVSTLVPYPQPSGAPLPPPAAACPHGASTPVKQHFSGEGLVRALATATYSECQAACCAEERCSLWNWDSALLPSARAAACKSGDGIGCCWLIANAGAPGCGGDGGGDGGGNTSGCCGVGLSGCVSWSGLAGRATVKLRSAFASHMVLQHGAVSHIAGSLVGLPSSVQADVVVTVALDGVTVGKGVTDADGTFTVDLPAQEVSARSHTLNVSMATAAAIQPAILADVLFGHTMLCAGQSNMQVPTWFADNATAELPAADWPLIRIAQVQRSWAATTPQADTAFNIPWQAVSTASVSQFSALCYYFGREIFLRLGGATPIGLIEVCSAPICRIPIRFQLICFKQKHARPGLLLPCLSGGCAAMAPLLRHLLSGPFLSLDFTAHVSLSCQADQGGTYIESFMPAAALSDCNTTGKRPSNWVPSGPLGNQTLDPWGAQNVPAALWNTMLSPLRPLNLKLVLYDQAEHNLATRESHQFGCLQDQLVSVLRQAWGAALTFHLVQLPSFNMSEFAYTYVDSLGEMRLGQASTDQDVRGTTTAITIDLWDLRSPWGSVHNRQKQIVGRRAALHALATAYCRHELNTGPTLSLAERTGGHVVLHVSSHGGDFHGSNECSQCCHQSAMESSSDGRTWTRMQADAVSARPDPTNKSEVVISLGAVTTGALWVRYAFDDLVQCPFFDADGIPLAPFKVRL